MIKLGRANLRVKDFVLVGDGNGKETKEEDNPPHTEG